ncbi:hypothetical protein G2W53_008246 [Senna tora]|uniref:Uncharacterized protein n=1 Tax=Senna tora TaxID=362788 RepID=A0A834X932_9FABA|nr:hypothetical protein G2W53_008246 [Senna tora]
MLCFSWISLTRADPLREIIAISDVGSFIGIIGSACFVKTTLPSRKGGFVSVSKRRIISLEPEDLTEDPEARIGTGDGDTWSQGDDELAALKNVEYDPPTMEKLIVHQVRHQQTLGMVKVGYAWKNKRRCPFVESLPIPIGHHPSQTCL